EVRSLQVWANADYPRDAVRARKFGAQGIGLDRTEHMFMETDRLPIVHEMILAAPEYRKVKRQRETVAKQLEAATNDRRRDLEGQLAEMDSRLEDLSRRYIGSLEHLGRMQREDFVGILREMAGLQVRAIFEAACRLKKEGVDVRPEIMIPLVGLPEELRIERHALEKEAKSVMDREGIPVDYKFGTMIEIPRAALVADEIARHAEFFSFGTNDLTQTTMGYSRDDAEPKFLLDYVEQGILPSNPFQTIDRDGVGQLMRICVQKGRKVRRDLEVGICGETGGDPGALE